MAVCVIALLLTGCASSSQISMLQTQADEAAAKADKAMQEVEQLKAAMGQDLTDAKAAADRAEAAADRADKASYRAEQTANKAESMAQKSEAIFMQKMKK